MMRNPSCDAPFYLCFFGSWTTFGGEMGWPHAHPLWSGDSKPDQKVGPLGGIFEPPAISKSCFRNFQS